ncbi:MAG TPA: hypothetical protein VJT49_14975 [Amycolatopsis sp.]|uniref:hypothetical protein n=1 Tax=Amycolatopsis sp. TaxID=37632 RepID=UPI002B496713|nr:hypothetical protein [Amycolatopsis sp.]HKS46382.1 hypothetical protein [Amycolatopsis sp.]
MAGVAYQVDPAESQRRRAGGHGAVTELGIIDALLGLPTGIPVPWTAVSDRDRRRLRRAPSGAVESRGDQLVRQATVPLTVRFALVAARQWRDGLVKAGRFAPYCCRAMLLSRVPGDLDEAKVQAAFYGIGIYLVSRGELTTVVVPEPFTESRHSPAQWWFAEEVYRQVSDSSTSGG